MTFSIDVTCSEEERLSILNWYQTQLEMMDDYLAGNADDANAQMLRKHIAQMIKDYE